MRRNFFGFSKPKIEFEGWEGEVETLPPPEWIRLPLSRPGQMPFNPVVEVGDRVKTGEFIAMLPSRTGTHSSVTGTVTSIGPGYLWDGAKVLTISIRRESDDEIETPRPLKNFESVSRDQLIEAIADLGFASPWKPESLQAKLSEIERIPIHTVIIRAVDSEPPISVQRRFLTEFAVDFAESVQGIKKIAGKARIIVAVPDSMEDKARSILKGVEVFPVGNSTLDTNTRLLVQKITGRFFTVRDSLRRHGIAVISAEDVAFVGRCLHKGKSRTNKLVTVSAPGLNKPVTVRVRIGTPVEHVLNSLDIRVSSGDRIIFGGPLMGVAQPDLQSCITMGVNGVIIIPREDVVHFRDNPCINCGRCVKICPVNIQVNLVSRYVEFGYFDRAVAGGTGSCVECGLCAYICPSHRPLLQYMKFANYEYDLQTEHKEAGEEGEE